jgi:tetratricopeptide (TPR) repeat protein
MKKTCVILFSLALVSGSVFSYASASNGPADQASQAKKFTITPEFSEAENVVEGLTGTPASDPDSQAKLLQARAVFQAAADSNPEATLPLNYLARTYSFPGQDMALGITLFEKSLALDPKQSDAIVRLVELCLKAGKDAKAEEVQAQFVNRTANPDLAARVERAIEKWASKEGPRLIREGHYREGVALMEKAISGCSDPAVQEGLRKTLKETTFEWEATQYNEALAKNKAGDYRGALAILQRLVAVARDPEISEKAKRFRDRLVPLVN